MTSSNLRLHWTNQHCKSRVTIAPAPSITIPIITKNQPNHPEKKYIIFASSITSKDITTTRTSIQQTLANSYFSLTRIEIFGIQLALLHKTNCNDKILKNTSNY
jgi:hypothetical protein